MMNSARSGVLIAGRTASQADRFRYDQLKHFTSDGNIPALAIFQGQRLDIPRLPVDFLQLGHPGEFADNAIALADALVLQRIELGDLLGEFGKCGHGSVAPDNCMPQLFTGLRLRFNDNLPSSRLLEPSVAQLIP